MKKDQDGATSSVRQILRALLPFADRASRRIPLLVATGVIGGITEAGVLVLITNAAVAATRHGDVTLGPLRATPLHTLGIAAAALLIKLAVSVIGASLTARLAAGSLAAARRSVLRAFLGASWSQQSAEDGGALQELMTTNVDRVSGIFLVFSQSVIALVSLISLFVVALFIAPIGAMVLIAAGLALTSGIRPLNRLTSRNASTYVRTNTSYASQVNSAVLLARDLKIYGVEEAALARIDSDQRRSAAAYRRSRFLNTVTAPVFQTLALGLVIGALAVVVAIGSNEIGELGAVVVLLLRGLAYAQQVVSGRQQLSDLAPHLQRLAGIRDTYLASADPVGTTSVANLGAIELHQVGYRYAPDEPLVLDGLTLRIEPGECVGVVGPSGSGKSTLIQLLLGLRTPTEGTLTAAGVPVGDIAPEDWHRLVAFVPQDSRLLQGTVGENIAFFRDLDQATIESAARRAHLHGEILRLPGGYDASGGENGVLSGGQRQRLSIARALVDTTEFLVLDEPTSALDVPSERRIQASLEDLHGRVTMVIVAHRVSTLDFCDKILVLDHGKVVGFDTREHLARAGGFFEDALRMSGVTT
jgi:ABC-type multidrug transport system fused ATPase/permease subunit